MTEKLENVSASSRERDSSAPPRPNFGLVPTSESVVDNLDMRIVGIAAGRILVALILLGGLLLMARFPGAPSSPFMVSSLSWLLVASFATSIGLVVALRSQTKRSVLARVSVVIDLCLTSFLIYLTGGVDSTYVFLGGAVICSAALLLNPRATVITTLATSLAYGLASASLDLQWIAQPSPHTVVVRSNFELAFALVRQSLGFVLVGALASYLAARLRQTAGDLRRAESNASSYAQFAGDVVRSLTAGLITTDLRGKIRFINDAGAMMLNSSSEELKDADVRSFFVCPNDFERAFADGKRIETHVKGSGSKPISVGLIHAPLLSEIGQHEGRLLVLEDLRELSLLREKAEHAERLAALGRLSAALAHEIRNPLSAISGFVDLVRESNHLDEEEKNILQTVLREAQRLDELVESMLEVGRPRPPQRTRINLQTLLQEVMHAASAQAQVMNVRFETKFVGSNFEVFADPSHMRQVAWNLIKNAIQFSPRDGIIEIGLEEKGQHDQRQVLVTVSDQGPGFEQEAESQLFDMFFTQRQQGVGIGLALVKQIIESHGGEIRAEQRLPHGARFIATLPG